MKKKSISLVLAVIMVISMIPFSLFTAAADDAGMTFDVNDIYSSAKFLEAAPNTFEFTVKLPK
ncbi:MAG: hypothetical protein IKJ04_07985, partial [Clostridia bacterium]|nr:hypothetical protein [Clostridia bacterium]